MQSIKTFAWINQFGMTLRTLNYDLVLSRWNRILPSNTMALLLYLFMRIIELDFCIYRQRERERERKKKMLIQIFSFALDNRTQWEKKNSLLFSSLLRLFIHNDDHFIIVEISIRSKIMNNKLLIILYVSAFNICSIIANNSFDFRFLSYNGM